MSLTPSPMAGFLLFPAWAMNSRLRRFPQFCTRWTFRLFRRGEQEPIVSKRPPIDGLRQELRRGTLVLAVLAVLRIEQNGTGVQDALADVDIDIEEGPLYPMLRRLEDQGLLTSEWRAEGSRTKRFYKLSPFGAETYAQLLREWRLQSAALNSLTGGSDGRSD